MNSPGKRVCLVPKLSGVGGMVSFQDKLSAGLISRGYEICYDLNDPSCDAILVIGGTRHLHKLYAARKRKTRIIQRLDGMNWIHRVKSSTRKGFDLRHYLRSEYGNIILNLVRSNFADFIVYQSQFSRSWWENDRGNTPVQSTVIYNGVNLETFSPKGKSTTPIDHFRILMVEGSLMGGYETGLAVGYQLAVKLARHYENNRTRKVELVIAGRVSENIRKQWKNQITSGINSENIRLSWQGVVAHENIPAIDRSAHVLYSSDVNAACPNSVIEALACGLPVLAFDTGALPELVRDGSGQVVPYGGNVWQLDPPDVNSLVLGAVDILENQPSYRSAARQRAENVFDLEKMVDNYIDVLFP